MARLDPARLARLTPVLDGHVRRGLPGVVVLIARGDQIHVEAHGVADVGTGAPLGPHALFRIASVSKPLAAATAMTLVEEGALTLDAPVAPWLPELAEPKVLRSLAGPVDDVVPAERPITLRHLLTFTFGFGAIMAAPGTYPIQGRIAEAGLAPGPDPSPLGPDEWMQRLSSLPLLFQPGDGWAYHTGLDVLGVLLARVSGRSLGELMRERLFEPLTMPDTGFYAPPAALPRLGGQYFAGPDGALCQWDAAGSARWGAPPAFESGGGGLVSTAHDLLAFGRMMLQHGRAPAGGRVLSRAAVELMTSDQVTRAQKAASPFFPGFWDTTGWGFGLGVTTARRNLGPYPGAFGWMGGTGTSFSADPAADLIVLTLTQRMMGGADDTALFDHVTTLAYQALDD